MVEIFQTRGLFFVATFFYLLAFALGIFCFLRRTPSRGFGLATFGALFLGWGVQLLALYERGVSTDTLPLRNTFELLQTLGWSAVFAMGFLRIVWSMRVPAVLTSALALGLSGLGLANARAWDIFVASGEKSPWVSVHVLFVFFGYAFWTAAALVWLAYFLQDRALRRRKTNRFYALLPDLASLDRVAGRLTACGLVALAGSVVVGAINLLSGDVLAPLFVGYKIFVSLVLIAGNAWLVFLRRRNRITGRVFAKRGLAIFALGVVLLGGLTCVRTATNVPAKDVPAIESAENVR